MIASEALNLLTEGSKMITLTIPIVFQVNRNSRTTRLNLLINVYERQAQEVATPLGEISNNLVNR